MTRLLRSRFDFGLGHRPFVPRRAALANAVMVHVRDRRAAGAVVDADTGAPPAPPAAHRLEKGGRVAASIRFGSSKSLHWIMGSGRSAALALRWNERRA